MALSELGMLIMQLNRKEPQFHNFALHTLLERSQKSNEVYRYWSVLEFKLLNKNPIQQKAGLLLLSANTKWDEKNRLDLIIDDYLALASGKNFEIALICIQSLKDILPFKPKLQNHIKCKLKELDFSNWNDQQINTLKLSIQELFSFT